MQAISCFYHPTTIVLIDDNVDFLNNLMLSISPYYRCLPFFSPQQAQEFLQKNHEKHSSENYLKLAYSTPALQVEIKLEDIYQQVFNRHRFDQTVICVVDYDMPEIDGLALAKTLKNTLPIKVIMLTGEADHSTAVRAFNQNVIDSFVLKSALDYPQQLLSYFAQLQQAYFLSSSTSILESLTSQPQHPLQDQDFIVLFQQLCLEHQIIEYYLVDESGSFLLLDAAGNKFWLMVRTEADMQTCADLAESDDMPELAQSFVSHQKIASFPNPQEQFSPAKTWRVSNAIQLKNKPIYYCLLKNEENYALNREIVSYADFLQF